MTTKALETSIFNKTQESLLPQTKLCDFFTSVNVILHGNGSFIYSKLQFPNLRGLDASFDNVKESKDFGFTKASVKELVTQLNV